MVNLNLSHLFSKEPHTFLFERLLKDLPYITNINYVKKNGNVWNIVKRHQATYLEVSLHSNFVEKTNEMWKKIEKLNNWCYEWLEENE